MSLNLLDQIEQGLAPKKVDIVQFAESDQYCNVALYPGQATLLKLIFLEEMTDREEDQLTYWINGGRGGNEIRISPNIRERRDFLRDNEYNHFRLVELIGGRRSSKGFTTGLAMAYTMYNTLMLGDPGGAYGIDKEKDIYFSCVAGSESQAKEFQFGDFVSRVETCKAFEPYIVKSLETELRVATQDDLRKTSGAKSRGGKIQRDIARLRGKALAANAGTLRGSATMCICIDEAAHLIPGESKSSLDQIFTAAEPSLDQFGLDGMIFLNSSPYTKVGMFYEVYENCMKPFDPTAPVSFSTMAEMDTDDIAAVNSDPRSMAFQYASWNLFEGYRYYKSKYQPRTRGKMFGKMPTVSPDWDPNEVDEDGRELYTIPDRQAILQARAKEASNPEAYKVERRGKFAEVTDAYMNPSMIDRIYQGRPGDLRRQPNGDLVRDYIPFVANYGQEAINLYRYKFHLDPSSTTAGFGFAIGHVEYFPNQINGIEEEHVVLDMIKGWDPRSMPGKVIRWEPILQEIVTLAEMFRPYEITMDQHQCLAGDTLISTDEGLVRINELGADLEVGKGRSVGNLKVLSHHDHEPEATWIHRRGSSPTKKLKVRGGYQIEATDDHRLWVQKQKIKPWHPYPTPQWEFVRDIKIGDRLLIQPGSIVSDQYLSVREAGFERHANCTIGKLPIICDEDLAAYLGWMISEGYVPTEPTSNMGSFTNAESEAWESFVGLSFRLFGHIPNVSIRSVTEDATTLQAHVPRSINRFLNNLGVNGPSHLKKIPDVIFGSHPKVVKAFLQTLFDGDGSVAIRRDDDVEIVYSTESPVLAEGIQQLLLTLGIFSTLYQDPHNPELREHPLHRVKIFGINIVRFMDEVGFVSARKGNKALEAYKIASSKTSVRDNKSYDAKDSMWKRIISIEESFADCYDLSVPGQESFVANGIVSHNSAEPIQDLQERLSKRNIACRVYVTPTTNEANWKRWEVFKTATYQGRIHAPCNEEPMPSALGTGNITSQDEFKFLQQVNTSGKYPRIDKQDIGPVQTKDRADAVCQVVHDLVGNMFLTTLQQRLSSGALYGGAPGGYGIGNAGYPTGGDGPPGISGYYSRRDEKLAQQGMTRSSKTRGSLGGRTQGRTRGISPRGR
jgi:intein/homing endonuclease